MNFLFVILSAALFVAPLFNTGVYFLGWVALIPFLYVIKNKKQNEIILYSWFLGMLIMAGSCYWLYYPVALHSPIPGPVAALLVMILFVLLGLFYAFWGYLYSVIKSRQGFYPFILAFSWTGIEFIRYYFLTALPFGFLGYTQHGYNSLLQFAEIGGVFLVSFIVLLINGYIYSILFLRNKKAFFVLTIILIAITAAGTLRYYQIANKNYDKLSAGVVSTAVSQEDKWRPEMVENNLKKISELAVNLSEKTLIITPETSLTFDLIRNNYYREMFFEQIEEIDSYIIAGSLALGPEDEIYNTSFLLAPNKEILDLYRKNALVPFGEYLPLEDVLKNIVNLNISSQAPGQKVTKFETDYAFWISPICSEILNPDFLRNNTADTDFIINQSNEAWFGISNLQEQMWTAAVFRAVENRRAVIKAGNFAFSGLIHPSGQTLSRTDPGEIAATEVDIVLNNTETFYQKGGNWIGLISVFLILMFVSIKSYKYN